MSHFVWQKEGSDTEDCTSVHQPAEHESEVIHETSECPQKIATDDALGG